MQPVSGATTRALFAVVTTLLIASVALLAAASANAFYIDSEVFPLELESTSSNEHVFTVEDELKLVCKSVSMTGTMSETGYSVSMTPSFSECTAFGISATVSTTGCAYVLTGEEETETEETFGATVGVDCEEGKAITITAGTCVLKIPTQTDLGEVTVTNVATSPPSATVDLAITEATYEKTTDGFLCPLTGTGVKENGALTGSSTVTGKVEGEAAPVQVIARTVLCKDKNGNKCAAGQEMKSKGTTLSGTATDFKLVVHYDDGVNSKNVTVTCGKAYFSSTTKGHLVAGSQLENPLETLSTETCVEDNAKSCTVEVRELPTTGWLAAGKGDTGNGTWEVTVKLKVNCGSVPLLCYVGKKIFFDFEGNATAAKIKSNGLTLDREQPGAEEKNCGKNAAKLTVTYALTFAAFLRMQ